MNESCVSDLLSTMCRSDTDTIAAMAGAISGAYLGHAAIPNHLLENLEDREQGKTYIEILASKIFAAYKKITKLNN